MKFGKFELNLAPFGFVKFAIAACKFIFIKRASTDFAAVRIKKVRVLPTEYKFDGRVKFDKFGQIFASSFFRIARQI